MARRRKFSDEPFGPTIERLMGETGVTYRGLADKTKLSAGYLNHLVHGNRPVPSDKVVGQLAKALGVEPEHFREYRLRVITQQARSDAGPDRPPLQAPRLALDRSPRPGAACQGIACDAVRRPYGQPAGRSANQAGS